MSLPVDDNILLSLVNTYLRDGGTLDDFCAERDADGKQVICRLESAGYYFDESGNAFKRK